DAAVIRDAVESARREKQEVTVALLISAILTVIFVLATRRRLKEQLDADAAIERRRRAELETISIRFGMATRAARAGVYEVHENSRTVWWSDTMNELYGQSSQTFRPTLDGWLELIHPADRAAAQAAMAAAMRERKQLHNVGNVLNSVNVSANLVTESLKRSRAAGLGRVVSLLQEHQSDLGRFVAHDERGKVLPVYLAELSRHLSADNQNALQELDSLKSNIDHIKDIVAMQQRYAKLGGLAEMIDIRHLVEESMRINASAFERHAVKVMREFADVPQITVDKHKVLQILVNLLRNAKDACESMGGQE